MQRSAGRDRACQTLMMCYDQEPCLLGRQRWRDVLAAPKDIGCIGAVLMREPTRYIRKELAHDMTATRLSQQNGTGALQKQLRVMAAMRRCFRGPEDVLRSYFVPVLTPAPSRVALRRPRRSHDGAYSVCWVSCSAVVPLILWISSRLQLQLQLPPQPRSRKVAGQSGRGRLEKAMEATKGRPCSRSRIAKVLLGRLVDW